MDDRDPRSAVAANLAAVPVIGVVRTTSDAEAAETAATYLEGGLKMIEITFTVPDAVGVVESLAESAAAAGASLGMGTVTTGDRAARAVAAGAEFIVSPNVSAEVAERARAAGRYLILGALTSTEIVAARQLGADLVKVYPLATVGGAAYMEIVRQPLGDIPMLAAGGFGLDDIPSYRAAGAVAFGLGPPLLGASRAESLTKIRRAIALATGRSDS